MPRFCLAGLLVVALSGLTVAQPKPVPTTGNIYKRSIKSVVWVVIPQGGGRYRSGSGTLIDTKDRIIITNYHVVGDEATVSVLFPVFDKSGNPINDRTEYFKLINAGGALKGKVLAREPKRDLAIVQLDSIPKDSPAMRIAKDPVGTADPIHVIGSSGISSGLFDYCPGAVRNVVHRKSKPKDADPPFTIDCKMVEHTAPVNKGQSGGPVMNDAGELVAVTQGHVTAENANPISLAVDVSEVKEFLKANKYARLLHAPASAVASATVAPKDPSPPAETDPKAEAAKHEKFAANKLLLAKDLLGSGKKDKAKNHLDDILKDYPNTKAAEEAKKLLESLK